MPHEISTSLRLILAGPTPLRGGATQKCGGAAPAIIFVCPSPTRVGAAEDEVMGGDDLLGLRNAPPPRLSSSDPTSKIVLPLFDCERNVHLKVTDPLLKRALKLMPDPL